MSSKRLTLGPFPEAMHVTHLIVQQDGKKWRVPIGANGSVPALNDTLTIDELPPVVEPADEETQSKAEVRAAVNARIDAYRDAIVFSSTKPLSEVARGAVTNLCHLARRMFAERDIARDIVKKHDLCHNMHGKVDARAFAAGCAMEQRKHFGCAPDADEVKLLRSDLESERRRHDMTWNAWCREIGTATGGFVPKMHPIDSLVVTTRKLGEDLKAARAELAKLRAMPTPAAVEAWKKRCEDHLAARMPQGILEVAQLFKDAHDMLRSAAAPATPAVPFDEGIKKLAEVSKGIEFHCKKCGKLTTRCECSPDADALSALRAACNAFTPCKDCADDPHWYDIVALANPAANDDDLPCENCGDPRSEHPGEQCYPKPPKLKPAKPEAEEDGS